MAARSHAGLARQRSAAASAALDGAPTTAAAASGSGTAYSLRVGVSTAGPRKIVAVKASAARLDDTMLPDSDGNEVRLGDLWRDRPVVFIWLRHYG